LLSLECKNTQKKEQKQKITKSKTTTKKTKKTYFKNDIIKYTTNMKLCHAKNVVAELKFREPVTRSHSYL